MGKRPYLKASKLLKGKQKLTSVTLRNRREGFSPDRGREARTPLPQATGFKELLQGSFLLVRKRPHWEFSG